MKFLAVRREGTSIKWEMRGMPSQANSHKYIECQFDFESNLVHLCERNYTNFQYLKTILSEIDIVARVRELDNITHFSRVGTAAIQHSQITCSAEKMHLPDGTRICCNSSGAIIFADYSSGVKLARHEDYVMCTNTEGEHWLRDKKLVWYKID